MEKSKSPILTGIHYYNYFSFNLFIVYLTQYKTIFMTSNQRIKHTSSPFKKPILQVLNGKSFNPPPFWLMRQAGRYLPEYRKVRSQVENFLNLCLTPKHAVEVTLQPIRRYNMDAAILFSDILMVPYALGQNVDFRKSEGPVLEKLSNISKFCDFNIETFHHSLGPVYETINLVKEELDNNTTLIGFCGAPWTVATYMIEGGSTRDFTRVMSFARSQPEAFHGLLSILIEASFHYLNKQITSGAEVIQIFDSWAGVLNEKEFRQWVIKPTKEIIQRLHVQHPHIPVIGFPRQAGPLYTDYIKETGVTAISLDQTASVAWVAKNIQPLCAVQGNLDPRVLVAGGEAMQESLQEILSTLGEAPFIFNLGHGILPTTPPEHVAELTACIRSWSQQT